MIFEENIVDPNHEKNIEVNSVTMAGYTEATWTREYDLAKSNILSKRALGALVQPEEVKHFTNLVIALERGLQTMQASPMAFELTISEISRRQVITENLRKMLPLLTVSGSPLVAGKQSSDHIPPSTATNSNHYEVRNPVLLSGVSDKGLVQRQEDVIKVCFSFPIIF